MSDTIDMVDGSELLDISAYWSFWDRPIPETVPRDVAVPARLRDSLVLVVQGVRRCGKSTLLTQLVQRYRINPKHCAFLNFEDPRLGVELDHRLLDQWVAAFRDRHPRLKNAYFFLDEIQSVVGWEKWLRTQLERPRGNHFVITGSNAHLLSGELSGVLTGRHETVELFPLDLREYRRIRARAKLEDYLVEGGFPEPLLSERGDRLRQQYFSDIIERDIRERVGARSVVPVKQVAHMAFESVGAELSLRRIAGAAGIDRDGRELSRGMRGCVSALLGTVLRVFRAQARGAQQEVLPDRHGTQAHGGNADRCRPWKVARVRGLPRAAAPRAAGLLLARER